MNAAEIMTLQNAKVKDGTIRIAIMAGKLSGILRSADGQIRQASVFAEHADWNELLRVMEGTLDEATDHRAESSNLKSRPIR